MKSQTDNTNVHCSSNAQNFAPLFLGPGLNLKCVTSHPAEQSMLADCELERDLRLFEESSLCAAAVESLSNNADNDMVCPICTK